jgi:DUF4097 and DUF4098 domain-containing protein YvlB
MKQKRLFMFCAISLLLVCAVGAQASTRVEKTLKLEPGGTLYLDTSGGDVRILGTSEPGARVLVTSNLSDLEKAYDLRFDEEPHAVRIVAHRLSGVSLWHSHVSLRFEIQVPRQTSLELKTGGGDVNVSELEGTIRLKSSGGDVEASEVKGNLDGETSGGDIRVRQLSGDLRLHTSGGDVRAASVSGRVEVHSAGGDIEVSLVRGNASGGEVETSGGEIHVAVDPAVGLDVEASAGGGDVHSDLPLTITGKVSESNLRGTLGKGGQLLRLHSAGGDISVRPL